MHDVDLPRLRPDDHPATPGGGTLYVVSTPIGNLRDLSIRATEVLRNVAIIAAEDTRETRKLAAHVGSDARLVSLHAHSSEARISQVIDRLRAGEDVAVTTDAGTPGVSDPGPELVARARAAGLPVVPIPGPSAVHAALAASGLPADRYVFLGFPPRKGSAREEWLGRIRDSSFTVVCFEAPGRTADLFDDLVRVCGESRVAVLARELTKRFEEIRAGAVGELARTMRASTLRGEVTVVVAGGEEPEPAGEVESAQELALALRQAGVEPSRAAKVIAQVSGLSRNASYRLAMEER